MMGNKKKDLIIATTKLISEKHFSEINIKDIAKDAACTSGVIYRHFENLDQLLLYASVFFLEKYAHAAIPITEKGYHPLDLDRILWGVFADLALHNVEAFDYLFWHFPKDVVEEAICDYYQFFPDNWNQFNGLYISMFFSGDLMERNMVMLRWAATSGYLRLEDIHFIADLQCTYLYGLMMEIRHTYRLPDVAAASVERFKKGISEIHEHYRLDKSR